jgi:hypothetical protein
MSRALLEKLTVTQTDKKFPAFYGTQRFITMFIKEPASPRPCVTFHKRLFFFFFFYNEELLAPYPNPKLEDHPLLAVHECLFNIFATTLYIWRPFPPAIP